MRKVKTTPLQREILWALADTGECSLPSMLNNLSPKFQRLSPTLLGNEVQHSLGILYRAGCIYLMRIVDGERKDVVAPEMDVLDLDAMLSWSEAESGWMVSEDGVTDVVVLLTNGGVYWLDLIAAQS